MLITLKRTLKKCLTGLAAFSIAGSLAGVAVFGTATAAAADEVGVQSIYCESGTSAVHVNGVGVNAIQHFAWAKCRDSVPSNPSVFALSWKCTGQSGIHGSRWYDANGQTIRGYCPIGQRVEYYWPSTSPGPVSLAGARLTDASPVADHEAP
ncbi:hypothetical protein [Glycomyces harbinensis]|uniref:Secreted protein n=1 Tax=Glycomyces harbinensis TaxID=58114 RepID=A0A1G6RJB5_9ACTN|nr:hypothetical protein [Glycomyces harbinensis]SDD04067.1 hypothetical protein SAMN05216270_101495 [Glycomyces harbinensis]